jgi:hypothetical protein
MSRSDLNWDGIDEQDRQAIILMIPDWLHKLPPNVYRIVVRTCHGLVLHTEENDWQPEILVCPDYQLTIPMPEWKTLGFVEVRKQYVFSQKGRYS